MNLGESSEISSESELDRPVFKKPLLIGKVGKFPKKVLKENFEQKSESTLENVNEDTSNEQTEKKKESETLILEKDDVLDDKQLQLPYKEPIWSGMPETTNMQYRLEVLKSGSIIETINLMTKPFWVFGRLTNCDICMAHPTISRYHAILQYRSKELEDQPKGFYLYDLSSTHGTFLNKHKLKSRTYVKVYVGHLLKLGLSSRSYLLTGPENDTEEESELSVTELKAQRQEELANRVEAEKEALRKKKEEEEIMRKKLEERGVDWGLGEDADEDTDMTENPFAQTTNEELYLDDPKKALRGFMEREGYDLEYDCTEQGIGQFLCKVELPLDDDHGRPIVAEVLHKGKKKEAVIQCALEACRILDRYGVLRQATHESRKRKAKNWEENDFYDSDEDTFLDRTGTIEKKRENRMKAKQPTKPETYQSLLEKEAVLRREIGTIEKQLRDSNKNSSTIKSSMHGDSLDNYMKELKQMKLDKQTISRLKSDLSKHKQDLANVLKLINIAKPTDLPTLVKETGKISTSETKPKNKLPIFGKRLKIKVQLPERKENVSFNLNHEDEEEEEEEEIESSEVNLKTKTQEQHENQDVQETFKGKTSVPRVDVAKGAINDDEKLLTQYSKIDVSFKMIFPLMSNESERSLRNIWSKMKSLYPEYSAAVVQDITNLFSNYVSNFKFIDTSDTLSEATDSILHTLKLLKTKDDIIAAAQKLIEVAKEITLIANRLGHDDEIDESGEKMALDESEFDLEKKKKRNQRRIQQRQERAEIEKQKGYEEDSAKEDYNMWVPPAGQTGDGKTSLNEKYGY